MFALFCGATFVALKPPIAKDMKPFVVAIAILGACLVGVAPQAKADEKPQTAEDGDVYELRVFIGGMIPKHDNKPQILTRIKEGMLFFARNDDTPTLYVASGVLHPAKNGKFTLDYTILEWYSPRINTTDGPDTDIIELNKPFGHWGSSGGITTGFDALLTKVAPSTPTANNAEETSRPK